MECLYFQQQLNLQVASIEINIKKIWQRFTRHAVRNGEALLRIDLFNQMDGAARNRIAAFMHWRSFTPRESLYSQGSLAASCYWLIQGSVELFCRRPENAEERLRIVRPGEGFAFNALISNSLHMHSARAIEPCECLCLSSVDFTSLAQDHPETAVRLLLAVLSAQELIAAQYSEDYLQLTHRLTRADIIV
ncbi:cyclic nucleotide-binding domain-containing protein [candidate division KSB1 bacterium]|nr:cyclic nucleotide-binding domain-containing protein [candidate division KSB1 bacterium]